MPLTPRSTDDGDMTVQLPIQQRGRLPEDLLAGSSIDDTVTVPHAHPPKVEVFDLVEMTNTDPKGHVRRVQTYRVESWGLYMSRPVVGHPELTHFESWLLPGLGLRVTRQSWTESAAKDYDFYVDLVRIDTGRQRWRTLDLYLDLLVRTGRGVEVLDTDELLAAVEAGLLDTAGAQSALTDTYRAVAGISAHGYDIQRWLASKRINLTWETGQGFIR
jgi:uncharacterized protein